MPVGEAISCGFTRRATSSASVPLDAVLISAPVRAIASSAAPRKTSPSSTRRMIAMRRLSPLRV
jgi:hypothetical protein